MEKIPGVESIALAVAVWALGNVLGPLLGTMVLIIFGWFFGAIVGVWRMRFAEEDPRRRVKTFWFVVVSFGATVGAAAVVANMIAPWLKRTPAEILFFVAFAIPAIGMNWIDVAAWAWGLFRRRQEQRTGSDS